MNSPSQHIKVISDRYDSSGIRRSEIPLEVDELKDIKTFPERIYVAGMPLYMINNNTLEEVITKSG